MAIRSLSISTTVLLRARGIGKPSACQAVCGTILICCGSATESHTFLISEKSQDNAASRLYSTYINISFSYGRNSEPIYIAVTLSLVNRVPFAIIENFGISQEPYSLLAPAAGYCISVFITDSFYCSSPLEAVLSEFRESTGRTFYTFRLYIVETLYPY